MKLGNFLEPRVNNLIFIFRFRPYQDIERLILDFEQKFSSIFDNSRAHLTRVPANAPFEVPRFIFQNHSGKRLDVSLTEARLSLNLSKKEIDKIEQILTKTSDRLFDYFLGHNEIQLETFSSQTSLQIPSKQIDLDIQSKIQEKFFKFQSIEKLSNISFMYEEIKSNFAIAYTLGHYQSAIYDIPIPSQVEAGRTFIKVDMNNAKISETGLAVTIIVKDCNGPNQFSDMNSKYSSYVLTTVSEIKNSSKRFLL